MNLLEELMLGLRNGAERVEQELGEGGDWHPMLAVAKGDTLAITPVPGEFVQSGRSKNLLADLIRELRGQEPQAIGMVTSGWTLDIENATPEQTAYALKLANENRLAEHPRKREQLIISGYSKDEASTVARRILRSKTGKPRLVGEWKPMPVEQSGRFAEALAYAVGYEIPGLAERQARLDELLSDE